MSRARKAAFIAILLGLSAGAGLGLLEGYVRLFRPAVDLYGVTGRVSTIDPMAQWALADAFCAYRGKPGRYSERKSVNRHGFISTPELEVATPESTLRIAFLGESSTAGTGVNLPDRETWPWKVWEILQEQTPRKIEFINAALGGYSSFESYGRLWSRVRFFSPDILVLCHGWNELYYFTNVDGLASWRTLADGSWAVDNVRPPVAFYDPLPIDPFIRRSQALTHIRLGLSVPRSGEAAPTRPLARSYDQRGPEIWRTNLRLFRETARILGAKLLVAKQPTLIAAGLSARERARCHYDYHGFDHDAHVRAFQAIYAVIDQEIPADSVIDFPGVSGRSEYFFDHVHPTPEGTSAIANVVAEKLLEQIR